MARDVPDDKLQHEANGSLTMANGHAGSLSARGVRANKRASRTYKGWLLDKSAKLFVWYALITIFFRCPSSLTETTNDTPQVCKSYLQARDVVAPFAQPYYDRYLSHHVHAAQPYFARVQDHIYNPSVAAYQKYAAPRVSSAQQYGSEQWQRTLKPQLEVARKRAGKQLDATLGPHMKKLHHTVEPYYDSVKTSATNIWELEVQPIYRHGAPYVEKAYQQGHKFAVKTALPQAHYAGNAAWSLWIKQIWPRLRILYGENVEPQLLRISERLSRYRDGRKLLAAVKDQEAPSDPAFNTDPVSSDIIVPRETIVEDVVSSASSTESEAAPSATITETESFELDLQNWEHVCSIAVEDGAQHLTDHLSELSGKVTTSQIQGTGEALLSHLRNTADGSIDNVKAYILQAVSTLPEDASDDQIAAAHTSITENVRQAGKTVKQAAQDMRDWRKTLDNNVEEMVQEALQSTLETIDNIRDLRLSEIGRRYSDKALPHKMWLKYNDLKKETRAWRDDVGKVVKDNADLAKVREAIEDVESVGMAIVEDTATELGRLRNVGKWKATAGDIEDDFTTKTIPASVERATKRVVEGVQDAAESLVSDPIDAIQDTAESVLDSAVNAAKQAGSHASDIVIEPVQSVAKNAASVVLGSSSRASDTATDAAASVVSKVAQVKSQLVDSASKVASQASSAVVGTESSLSDTVTDVLSKASSVVVGTQSGFSDTATDVLSGASASVSSAASSLSSRASTYVSQQTLGPKAASIKAAMRKSAEASVNSVKSAASSILSAGDDLASSASASVSSLSSTGSKVWGGAMAQALVEAREPILDDNFDDTEDLYEQYSVELQKIFGVAGDKARDLTKAVSEAIYGTKTQDVGQSVSSVASEQYMSAISAASAILLGQKEAYSTGTSAVSSLYLSAVTAASHAIYGTPTAVSIAAVASSRYNDLLSIASKQYEDARTRISVQISGTPEPVHQQMFSAVETAYSEAISGASSRLQGWLGAVPTQNPFAASQGFYESISSVASSRLADGLASASAQYQNAKIAVGAEPTPVHQAYLASAQRAYYEGIGGAYDRYSSFIEAASSVVGANPTTGYHAYVAAAQNTYSAALAAASSNLQDLLDSASSAVGAKSKSPAESVLQSITSQYNAALSTASAQLASASSVASLVMFSSASSYLGKATDAAGQVYQDAASQVSAAIYGTETPWTEAMAKQAAANWDALLVGASERVYGTPLPLTDAILSQAGSYAAQATQMASGQYEAVQSLFKELVQGKEPDFTNSVMSRLQSAYATGAPALASSASSYASAAYVSASSAVNAVFTPPAQLDSLLAQVQEQLDAAVQAASAQVYGSTQGIVESVTEAAASAYTDASKGVSKLVYGKDTGLVEAAQATVSDVGLAASRAISEALFGTATGKVEMAQSSAAKVYSSMTSAASGQAAAAASAVSSALYGEEKGYAEMMGSSIAVAVASAQARIQELGEAAAKAASDSMGTVSEAVDGAASVASSAASSAASAASSYIHEEL